MKTLVKNNGSVTDMPSAFDDFFLRDFFQLPGFARTSSVTSVPSVNVMETEKSFELEIAAPGMRKENFKVELDGRQLTISAEKKNDQEHKSGNYTRREFNYSGFTRSFTLPEKMVESDAIAARYTDGILYLTIPKSKEAIRPSRLIEIE